MRRRGQRTRERLDNWCAPVIYYWCAPVEESADGERPSGWHPAQSRMVVAAKAVAPVAALEAGIPDVAALIFATLGIALALHGKRAIRARALNVGAVLTSITMNVLAAGHGWRDLAIWAMPPVAY